MEYEVLWSTGLEDLEEQVNKRLKEGWRCQGGIGPFSTLGNIYYLQAMIKE